MKFLKHFIPKLLGYEMFLKHSLTQAGAILKIIHLNVPPQHYFQTIPISLYSNVQDNSQIQQIDTPKNPHLIKQHTLEEQNYPGNAI